MEVFLLIILGTSVWMAFDAHQIGYDKKGVKGMGPVGWLFAGLLLWIITFPLYLVSRSKLKEAAAQKNGHGTPMGESPVGAAARHESEKKNLSSSIGRGFVNGVYALGALFVAIPLLIWVSGDSDDKMVSGQPASGQTAIARSAPQPASAADRETEELIARIKADTSPLAMKVKSFCGGKGDRCLVDQMGAALEVFALSQTHAPGSPEHKNLSDCFSRFGNDSGGGDYVRIAACATGNPVAPAQTSASGPTAEYKQQVAQIEAPNTLGAPGSFQNPAHREMIDTITDALRASPQAAKIASLTEDVSFAMVYLGCDVACLTHKPAVGLTGAEQAWVTTYSNLVERCFKAHQSHAEWPRKTFACVIEEENALIELNDRMSGDTSDIALLQRIDHCLTRYVEGKKARFSDANACVAKAQGGPKVGYSFARR